MRGPGTEQYLHGQLGPRFPSLCRHLVAGGLSQEEMKTV